MASEPGDQTDLAKNLQQALVVKETNILNTDSNDDSQDCLEATTRPSSVNSEKSSAAIPSENQLCETCLIVILESMISGGGVCDKGGFPTFTVGTVLANKACPSCRLIAYLISSYPDAKTIPKTASVFLSTGKYTFQERADTRIETLPCGMTQSPNWVDITVCRYGHDKEDENTGKHYYGSLVQVGEGDQKNYRTLFETPEHNGFIYARPLPKAVNLGMLRDWMKFCEESHDCCKQKVPNADGGTKLRLIDVRERRLVHSTLEVDYIALSYVWGKGTNGVLKKNTIEQYQCEGGLTKAVVPLTISNAMELAAELGERYLWADSACIIQDDIEDKRRQLPIMDSIYRSAKLVIIAAVDSANSGFPRWNKSQDLEIMKLPTEDLHGVRLSIGQPSLKTVMQDVVWNSRGWTFQEGILARRALIFTDWQLYWNCLEESWCEDRQTEFKDLRHGLSSQNSLLPTTFVAEPSCRDPHKAFLRTFCKIGVYSQKVEEYSRRKFSDYSDIFWAFFGILKSLRDKFPKGYIWALPYDHLDIFLLWQTCCAVSRNSGHTVLSEDGVARQIPIPSWCWLAKGHRVWYDGCHSKIISRVQWHRPVQYTDEYDVMTSNNSHAQDPQPSIFISPEAPVMEQELPGFALLHFTAQHTSLKLTLDSSEHCVQCFIEYLEKEDPKVPLTTCVVARIQLQSSKDIGRISVPAWVFHDGPEVCGEFILLSEYKGISPDEAKSSKFHKEGCKHSPALNIMLIGWCGNSRETDIAYRIAITKIKESFWNEAKLKERNIILG